MIETYPISIWINEGRYKKLQEAGLSDMAKDVLAGMKVLQLECTEAQKNEILKLYPMAKFDTATTKSIELLPAEVKDKMFELVVKRNNLDIMEGFLKSLN